MAPLNNKTTIVLYKFTVLCHVVCDGSNKNLGRNLCSAVLYQVEVCPGGCEVNCSAAL